MKRRTWSVCGALLLSAVLLEADAVALAPTSGSADSFFGLTKLYSFHFTVEPEQWAIMEEANELQDKPPPPAGPRNEPDGSRPPPPPGMDRPEPSPDGREPGMQPESKQGTAHLEFEGQPFGLVRIRFKGHSSLRFARHSLKRSLKLDFNDLEKGQTFFGLTKLNLNNNAMDPSQLREALAYHVFRSGGVPAGRTAFARVFITVPGKLNHAYAGLYTIVEQVDGRFLKARFGSKQGLLLKPENFGGWPFLRNDWAAYVTRAQPKSATTSLETSRFIEFVRIINLPDPAQFQTAVADYFDVDEYLRFLALECLLSNLDSPLMTGHNYYLYLHPKTRKFVFIPWDLNEAFGAFRPGGSPDAQMHLSLDQPFARTNRLAEFVLRSPFFQQRYHQIVQDLLAHQFSSSALFPVIDSMAATIRTSLASDPMVSMAEFEAALSEPEQPQRQEEESVWSSLFDFGFGQVERRAPPPSLRVFITQRVASVRLRLLGKKRGSVPREVRPGLRGQPGLRRNHIGPAEAIVD